MTPVLNDLSPAMSLGRNVDNILVDIFSSILAHKRNARNLLAKTLIGQLQPVEKGHTLFTSKTSLPMHTAVADTCE